MSFLNLLWWTSLAFAAIALCWMAGLIVARLAREAAERRRAADRQVVTSAFMAIMAGNGDAPARLRPYQKRARLMAEAILDLLVLVRGAERDRLIESLKGLHIDDRLRSRLFRGSRAGRLAAIEAIEAFPSKETRVALDRVYRSAESPTLRIAAVRALIETGTPPPLKETLSKWGSGIEESALLTPVLQRLVADAPDEALATLQSADLGPTACAMLVEALGASGDYRAVSLLVDLVQAADPVIRAASVRALGLLGHPAAAAAILAGMEDLDWEVRIEACEAAGRVGSTDFAPSLTARLADTQWWVRFRAAEALAALGTAGVEKLREASRSTNDIARRSAAMALAEKGL